MTMNSFRPNKSYRRLFAAATLALLIFCIDIFSGGVVRGEVRAAGITLSHWAKTASHALFGSGYFSSRSSLSAQNRSLSEQLAQYQERAAAYAVLQEENAILRDMVHLAQSTSGLTAPVVSSLRSSPYGTFLIGAGDADGVARGAVVLTSGGFVVGSVSDVASHTAVVSEIFAPGASLDAIVHGASVVVEGRGGGNARASAPRDLDIPPGSPVVAPAYGSRPIGIVGGVATSSSSATQDVFIHVPVNRAGIQFVYVAASQ